MKNDPLEVLIVPHEVLEWQKSKNMFLKKYFPKIAKQQREAGKWVIFHGSIRLWEIFASAEKANEKITEILSEKKKCWENKRIFSIKQL